MARLLAIIFTIITIFAMETKNEGNARTLTFYRGSYTPNSSPIRKGSENAWDKGRSLE